MGDWLVYCHRNKLNGKCYVGVTGQLPEQRWRNGKGYVGSTKFWNAIKKYGWDGFEHEILESHLDFQRACDLERFWIRELDSVENGYNSQYGGMDYCRHSAETRRKISESHLGIKSSRSPV